MVDLGVFTQCSSFRRLLALLLFTGVMIHQSAALSLHAVSKSNTNNNNNGSSSRREFLGKSAAAAAVAGSLTSSIPFPLPAKAMSTTTTAAAAAAVPGIDLPPIGLGAWAWGDSLFWKYDSKNDKDLQEVFDYACSAAATKTKKPLLLDTAEIYGLGGRSETLIGQFSAAAESSAGNTNNIQVATKFAAFPFRTSAQDVVKACRASTKRLGGRTIDLYQIHFPNAWSNEAYWDGLAECFDLGLVRAVGVSNYGVEATRACHQALAKRGIPLATNQIQYSLLYTHPEHNGLLQTCHDLGVQVLSYSPLGLGMLGGKYTPDKPPAGPRKAIYEQLQSTSDYESLLATMRHIGEKHSNASPAQVAINWTRAKGTVPIPGARTLSQVQSNYDALDWSLSGDEIQVLDEAAAKVTTFIQPGASPFPKQDINTGLIMFDS